MRSSECNLVQYLIESELNIAPIVSCGLRLRQILHVEGIARYYCNNGASERQSKRYFNCDCTE